MRQKLEVARALVPAKGALVLLDADTLVHRDLTPMVDALAQGALFLHKREFELGYSRRRGNMALWKEISQRTLRRLVFPPGRCDVEFRRDRAAGVRGAAARPGRPALRCRRRGRDPPLRHRAARSRPGTRPHSASARGDAVVDALLGQQEGVRHGDRQAPGRSDASAGLGPAAAAEVLRRNPINLPAEVRPGRLAKIKRWITGGRALVNGKRQYLELQSVNLFMTDPILESGSPDLGSADQRDY